jgi:organic hydroperoxide reductase OsmC/OhrA
LSRDQVESFEFRVTVNSTGDHRGDIVFDGKPALPTSSPAVFGGEADRYSPQELFISAVTACFLTTFADFAKRLKVTVKSLRIEGRGVVQRDAVSGWRFTDVFVTMHIGVPDAASKSSAQRVAELTEKFYMVSRSVKCQVHLETRISIVP